MLVERFQHQLADHGRDRVRHGEARQQRTEGEVPVAHLHMQVRRARATLAAPRDLFAGGVTEPTRRRKQVLIVFPAGALGGVHPSGEHGFERIKMAEHDEPAVRALQIERATEAHARSADALERRGGRCEHTRTGVSARRQIQSRVEVIRTRLAEATAKRPCVTFERPEQRTGERRGCCSGRGCG